MLGSLPSPFYISTLPMVMFYLLFLETAMKADVWSSPYVD